MIQFLKFKLNTQQIIDDLEDEANSYQILKNNFNKINKKEITIFYPGDGGDMLNILAIYDALIKNNKKLNIIMVDIRDLFSPAIQELKTYTNLKVKRKNNKAIARCLNKKITITYYQEDANTFFPTELKKGYDIYYERAFEIHRQDSNILEIASEYLNNNGLMITDKGFNLKNLKQIPNIPTEFGFYKNFQIQQKV